MLLSVSLALLPALSCDRAGAVCGPSAANAGEQARAARPFGRSMSIEDIATAVEKKRLLLFNTCGDDSPRRPQNGLAVNFLAGTGGCQTTVLPLLVNWYLPVFNCADYIIQQKCEQIKLARKSEGPFRTSHQETGRRGPVPNSPIGHVLEIRREDAGMTAIQGLSALRAGRFPKNLYSYNP
jgi:hypothetical protein